MRPRISAARRRRTASGLIRMSVCLHGHRRGTVTTRRDGDDGTRTAAVRPPSARPASRSAGRPATAPRAAPCSSTHACFSFVVQIGQTRNDRVDLGAADRAVQVALREAILHRLDLELALAHVLEVLRRPEEHVDERAEERHDDADEHGHPDDPRILDPPLRVLVDPVERREPDDDGEEDQQVADDEPRARAEEVCRCARDHKRILPIK